MDFSSIVPRFGARAGSGRRESYRRRARSAGKLPAVDVRLILALGVLVVAAAVAAVVIGAVDRRNARRGRHKEDFARERGWCYARCRLLDTFPCGVSLGRRSLAGA